MIFTVAPLYFISCNYKITNYLAQSILIIENFLVTDKVLKFFKLIIVNTLHGDIKIHVFDNSIVLFYRTRFLILNCAIKNFKIIHYNLVHFGKCVLVNLILINYKF